MVPFDPSLEGLHAPTGETDWLEAHRLDLIIEADGSAVSLQIARHPMRGSSSFLAAYLRPGAPPIVLSELEAPPLHDRWELRSSGLWADHICETPFSHWSYGLEAFALAIDDPEELITTGRGERVPLGWELEFESESEPALLGRHGYTQTGVGHGLILTADGEREVDGIALRSHWWGTGGPVELHVGDEHRPILSRAVLPALTGNWQLDVGRSGLRSRLV